jgi:predicted ferric reductase
VIAVTPQLSWYVARSSGMIGWAMVTASIVWGLAVSSRPLRARGVQGRLLDLHRYLAVLSVVFTAIHVAALVADNYIRFGWRELLVPMASTYRPGAVAWGIVAAYALIAIMATSWLMRWLPRRLWHGIHMLSIVLFVASTVHGFTAGTDRTNKLLQLGAFTGFTLAICLLVFRTLSTAHRSSSRKVKRPAPRDAQRRREMADR